MATWKITGFEELEEQLKNLSNKEDIAIKMVDSAVPVMEEALRSEITAAASKGYATGALASSVKGTKIKINQYGVYAAVLVTGTDGKGVRNAEKLAYMEYGTTRQAPRPVVQKAVNKSEAKCIKKMQEVLDSEVGK